MSLRILFADDSMTAQSMGKKILSEAGYEVVAVSNGAAAVKKIAEQKPDIIILDVYMPGYSGLEVCEKVRGSMDTLKTPVLLTVGKMEPYRAEDGNRVRADGVIVKPFEASDLLAIVKKLEERIHRAPVRVEQAVLADHGYQNADATAATEVLVEPVEPAFAAAAHSTVEVPDHMAGSSAFGDLLAAEPVSSIPEMAVAPPPVADTRPAPAPPLPPPAIPEYEIPVSWRDHEEPEAARAETVPAPEIAVPEPELLSIPVEPAIAEPEPPAPGPPPAPELAVPQVAAVEEPEPAVLEPVAPGSLESVIAAPEPPASRASENYPSPGGARPLHIPVYSEPEPQASTYEFMPTSASNIGEIEIPREPQLQETAQEATRKTVADTVDPGLMTTREQFELEHGYRSQTEAAELAPVEAVEPAPVEAEPPSGHLQDIPADIAAHAPPVIEAVAPETHSSTLAPGPSVHSEEARVSEDDFEARVAAAMAAYKVPEPDIAAGGYRESEVERATTEAFGVVPAQEPEGYDYHPTDRYEPPVVASAHEEPKTEPEIVAYTGVAEPESVTHPAAAAEPAIAAEPQAAAEPEYRIPTFEYHPPVEAPEPVQPEPEPAPGAHIEAVQPSDVGREIHEASAPELERAAAAAAGAGANHDAISQAVHRVMERLKPELVDEILRELKSKD